MIAYSQHRVKATVTVRPAVVPSSIASAMASDRLVYFRPMEFIYNSSVRTLVHAAI